MKPWCVTIQMKAIEQYFYVVLFMPCKVFLTFKSDIETLVKAVLEVFLYGTVYYLNLF